MKQFLLYLSLLLPICAISQSLENDRLALVSLYNSTNGAAWTNNIGWSVPGTPGDNPCGWFGVSCTAGRVTDLYLNGNNLSGNIPPLLGSITNLKNLWLHSNKLSGSIPTEIGNLINLKWLNLYDNRLTGAIPASLGNLLNVLDLHLSRNQLDGNIPVSFGNLRTLLRLTLYSNSLTGSIPPELGNLVELQELSLSENRLSGSIPIQFGNLSKLNFIWLNGNQLTGSIPSELGNLNALQAIDFGNNKLTGSIPPHLGSAQSLKQIYLYSNQLTGSIPSELFNLSDLNTLLLDFNQLTGEIPPSIGRLSKLTSLVLAFNNLSGKVPYLTDIQSSAYVDISRNYFTFDGMESNISKLDYYNVQGSIGLKYTTRTLSVNAGGTMSNNTYKWYKDGILVQTTTGSNSYTVSATGTYRVEVTNSIATALTLVSENYVLQSLPVTLVDFSGKAIEDNNILQWSTTAETNNEGFEIQRSSDAKTFVKIGYVAGKGNSSSLQTYQFSDKPLSSENYYRLKQIDIDGKFSHSRIIFMENRLQKMKVYPNPAKDLVTVEVSEIGAPMEIFDLNGKKIYSGAVMPKQSLSVNKWPSGVYWVKVGNKSEKLILEK